MEEYVWILCHEELVKLKQAASDEYIWCQQEMKFKKSVSVKFIIGICRKVDGSERTDLDYGLMNQMSMHLMEVLVLWLMKLNILTIIGRFGI